MQHHIINNAENHIKRVGGGVVLALNVYVCQEIVIRSISS